MIIKFKDLIHQLNKAYPESDAMTWDHPGLQIGDPGSTVNKVLTTLDITPKIVKKALDQNFDTIVSHHPLLFHPIQKFDISIPRNSMNQQIIMNNINVYSMHTNVDVGNNGTNDWLAQLIHLKNIEEIIPVKTCNGSKNIGRIGETDLTVKQIAEIFHRKLKLPEFRVLNPKNKIKKVAIIGGSGAEFINSAFNDGADMFITGDIKYHDFLDAMINNYCLLDVGHVAEKIFADKMARFILNKLPIKAEAADLEDMNISTLEEI